MLSSSYGTRAAIARDVSDARTQGPTQFAQSVRFLVARDSAPERLPFFPCADAIRYGIASSASSEKAPDLRKRDGRAGRPGVNAALTSARYRRRAAPRREKRAAKRSQRRSTMCYFSPGAPPFLTGRRFYCRPEEAASFECLTSKDFNQTNRRRRARRASSFDWCESRRR